MSQHCFVSFLANAHVRVYYVEFNGSKINLHVCTTEDYEVNTEDYEVKTIETVQS